jgi:hypothetical protein
MGGWVGPRSGLEKSGKSRLPTGNQFPDRPASTESLCLLCYPTPRASSYIKNNHTFSIFIIICLFTFNPLGASRCPSAEVSKLRIADKHVIQMCIICTQIIITNVKINSLVFNHKLYIQWVLHRSLSDSCKFHWHWHNSYYSICNFVSSLIRCLDNPLCIWVNKIYFIWQIRKHVERSYNGVGHYFPFITLFHKAKYS